MSKRKLSYILFGAAALLLALTMAGSFSIIPKAFSAPLELQEFDFPQAPDQDDEVVLSYAAKFVCTRAQPAGVPFFGPVAPVVEQRTEILVQNPNDYPVEIFKVANLSPVEPDPPAAIEPLSWIRYGLIPPGGSFMINCNDIAEHLLQIPFEVGMTYEGIVTIAVGPHQLFEEKLYPQLDVIGEYTRGSEVLKKDIHYQPWWTYWPWEASWEGKFPWRLGYPYQRTIFVGPADVPDQYSCREHLFDQMKDDVDILVIEPIANELLDAALYEGKQQYFRSDYPLEEPVFDLPPENPEPAIVPIIGRCEVMIDNMQKYLDISYVVVTNVSPLGIPVVDYPWIPGRWYDMPVVISQNTSMDFDMMFRDWHAYLWAAHQDFVNEPAYYNQFLVYYFPYWSGWTGWWWNYNGIDSIDIGVGEGESIDVEQIMPLRLVKPWQVINITP